MSDAHYDNKYFDDRDHLDLHIANSIRIFAQEHKLSRILDVGCGTGRLVSFLNSHGFDASGCDIEDEAVKTATKLNKKGLIKKCSATRLTYPKNSFELITSISVIEHLNEPQGKLFISEANRVLKNDGWIFLITPNWSSPLRYLLGKNWFAYKDPTHIFYYTPSTLAILLKKNGFTDFKLKFKIDQTVTFDWHLPLPARNLPHSIQYLLTWIMISSPLSTFRDSFWIAAKKG